MTGNIPRPEQHPDLPITPRQIADAAIDAANADDPHTIVIDGVERPKEQAHAELMTRWVRTLSPDCSDAQLIAARAHHLRRWAIPRSDHPPGRAGYLRWRAALRRRHVEDVARIMADAGYGEDDIERVQAIMSKKGLGRDPEAQVHEDALCLVFLDPQLDAVAAQIDDDDKVVEILRKSAAKMSPGGRAAASRLQLSPEGQRLLALALGVERAGRLVEQQQRRIAQDRPGDRDALALTAGQANPLLAEEAVEALRQVIQAWQAKDLDRGLARIDPAARELLRMRYALDLTQAEIAARLPTSAMLVGGYLALVAHTDDIAQRFITIFETHLAPKDWQDGLDTAKARELATTLAQLQATARQVLAAALRVQLPHRLAHAHGRGNGAIGRWKCGHDSIADGLDDRPGAGSDALSSLERDEWRPAVPGVRRPSPRPPLRYRGPSPSPNLG